MRTNPDLLVTDPTRELRAFRLTQMSALGAKRGTGRGAFIDSVIDAVDTFYEDVVGRLKSWTAPPPRLRDDPDTTDAGVPAALVSAGLSSQDDPEHGDDHEPTTTSPSSTQAAVPEHLEHAASQESGVDSPTSASATARSTESPADEEGPATDTHTQVPEVNAPNAASPGQDVSWASFAPAPSAVRPLPTSFS